MNKKTFSTNEYDSINITMIETLKD